MVTFVFCQVCHPSLLWEAELATHRPIDGFRLLARPHRSGGAQPVSVGGLASLVVGPVGTGGICQGREQLQQFT